MAPPVKAQKVASVAAILAAGGRGSRFAQGLSNSDASELQPKQFVQLHGHPMYVWSLRCFLDHPSINKVVIVMPPDVVTEVEAEAAKWQSRGKDIQVVPGGETRQQSVFRGLKALSSDAPDYVLIHDAARPFLTAEIIDSVIEKVTICGACTAGVRPADTVKTVLRDAIVETLDRQALLLVQTPQAGRFDWLMQAHEAAEKKGLNTTDDAALLEAAGHEVGVVSGSPYNMKLTCYEDLVLCEALAGIVFKDRL